MTRTRTAGSRTDLTTGRRWIGLVSLAVLTAACTSDADDAATTSRSPAMASTNATAGDLELRVDRVQTEVGAAVAVDPMVNDVAPEPRTVELHEEAGAPAHGSASVEAGSVRYQPGPGFRGVDRVPYRVRAASGEEAVGAVEIDVGRTTTTASTAIGWRECTADEIPGDDEFRQQMQCAVVRVPVDHAQPDGATLELFVSRRQSPQQPSLGPLFVNQGGPGAEAATFALSMSVYPGFDRFDIVGMDPRGTGRSTPVACRSDIRNVPPPVVPQPGDPETNFERAVATFAAGCATDPNLAFFGTKNTARDIDRIRGFLGADEITYFGKSYGSDLGATYVSMFPSHVRAAVLDGATDLTLDPTDFYIQQALALQRQLERYVAHCRADGCRWTNGLDAKAAWAQLIDRLEATPVTGGSGEELTAGAVLDFTGAFRDMPYPEVDAALDSLVIDGDPSSILEMQDDNSTWDDDRARLITAFVAITCLDMPIESFRDSARRLYDAVPSAPPDSATTLAYCGAWPVADRVVIERSQDSGPVLVVSTKGDVETPYESGVGLAAALEHATLLTAEANTHTAYLTSECVRAIVDAFLTELTTPAPDTSCPDDVTPSAVPDDEADVAPQP